MIPEPITAMTRKPVPSPSATSRRARSSPTLAGAGLGLAGELAHARHSATSAAMRSPELGDRGVERGLGADLGTGSGMDQCSQSGCGSSSSWARSHTVTTSAGSRVDVVEVSWTRVGEVETGRRPAATAPGWTRAAGWVPADVAGFDRDLAPQRRRQVVNGPSSACRRTAPAAARPRPEPSGSGSADGTKQTYRAASVAARLAPGDQARRLEHVEVVRQRGWTRGRNAA